MPEPVRLIKHEAVPKSGSYEVRFSDGSASRYFYWDDIPIRRLNSDQVAARRPWRKLEPSLELSAISDDDARCPRCPNLARCRRESGPLLPTARNISSLMMSDP